MEDGEIKKREKSGRNTLIKKVERRSMLQFFLTKDCNNAQKHGYVHTLKVLISKLHLFLPKYSGAVRLSYHHGDQEDVR